MWNGASGNIICPADYAGNGGTISLGYPDAGYPTTDGTDLNGIFLGVLHVRVPSPSTLPGGKRPVTSAVLKGSALTFTGIPDGLSNTLMIGEKAVNKLTAQSPASGTWGDYENYAEGLAWDNIRYGCYGDAYDPHPYTPAAHKGQVPNNPVQDQAAPASITSNPTDPAWPNWRWGSAHPGGFNAVMADGSVRRINYNIDLTVQYALCNRMDGLVVNLDQ
jgi:prepilin-type processing-associated H-X9-DG protein